MKTKGSVQAPDGGLRATTARELEAILDFPPLHTTSVHHNVEEILDVYFVDDGCYMIAHKQAAEFVK